MSIFSSYYSGSYSAPHAPWKRYILYSILGLAALVFAYVLFISITYLFKRSEIATKLTEYREWVYGTGSQEKKPAITIHAANGTLLGEYLPERGSWMTLSACSELKWLKRATIVTEDQDFYSHGGVSYGAILRAVWSNLRALGIREGGGTLTQQLARNLFTGSERTLYRKIYETLVAFQIEGALIKDEILCLYLNKIYMGEGRIGAEEASWFYFEKPPWKLDAAEAAMIVGLFPSPVLYSPLNNIELSLKKQRIVLDRMVEAGKLSLKERDQSIKRFLKRYRIKEGLSHDHGRIGLYGASRDFRYNIAPTVNQYVKNFLYDSIPEDLIREGGLRVYTTIDPRRQAVALQVLRGQVAALRKRMLTQNKKADPQVLAQLTEALNGAFISLDAFSGRLRAVVGGYKVTEGNMAQRIWSMLRQPGSSIKGFLYAAAMDAETLHPNSVVVDEPLNIGGYRPRNWNKKYLGRVPLSRAVAMSINTVAVKTLHDLGISAFRGRLAEVLGLGFFARRKRFPGNLSLALGSAELTPLELAQLYAPIVNGGYAIRPYLVRRVEDAKRQILWKISGASSRRRGPLFSAEACAGVLKLMEFVFDPDLNGTAAFVGRKRQKNSAYLPFPIAGKTGTVQMSARVRKRYPGIWGVRDIWFVGLVPREVSVVWFGHDDGAPIPGGGATAASSWVTYAQRALSGKITENFSEIEIFVNTSLPEEELLLEEESLAEEEALAQAEQETKTEEAEETEETEEAEETEEKEKLKAILEAAASSTVKDKKPDSSEDNPVKEKFAKQILEKEIPKNEKDSREGAGDSSGVDSSTERRPPDKEEAQPSEDTP